MLERIKNEPIMLVMIVLAAINIVLGGDGREVIETVSLLVGGGVARQAVTPTRKLG